MTDPADRARAPCSEPADPFGEVLPDGTRDEDGRAWGESPDRDGDDWLQAEVPPHHG